MRSRRRSSGSKRTRAVPAKSRVSVRRGGASLRSNVNLRPDPTVDVDVAAALRSSREALANIEGQLDALLATLRDPTAALDRRAPDRLRGATRDAGTALATLGATLAAY